MVSSVSGCIYSLERLRMLRLAAHVLAEIIGYKINSDASDYVLPNRLDKLIHASSTQISQINANDRHRQYHATSTPMGDIQECKAIEAVFSDCPTTYQQYRALWTFHGTAGP